MATFHDRLMKAYEEAGDDAARRAPLAEAGRLINELEEMREDGVGTFAERQAIRDRIGELLRQSHDYSAPEVSWVSPPMV